LSDSKLPADRLWQPTTAKWFFVVFGLSLVYAVIRYHFVKGVAWEHFPLFILNKVVSLAATIFFADGRLNLEGEIAMATGAFAIWFLVSPAITTLPMMPAAIGGKRWKRSQRLGYLAQVCVVIHLVALGLKGWLAPEKWSCVPPISLFAVVAASIPIVVKLMGR
jgi:DMSO/TMAO reductase YedYZ heme-binding membrane subunit